MIVHAFAFRHKMEGEGIGGIEWGLERQAVLDKIVMLGLLDDPNYEVVEQRFQVPAAVDHFAASQYPQMISEAIDNAFWADFHGRTTDVQVLPDWE